MKLITLTFFLLGGIVYGDKLKCCDSSDDANPDDLVFIEAEEAAACKSLETSDCQACVIIFNPTMKKFAQKCIKKDDTLLNHFGKSIENMSGGNDSCRYHMETDVIGTESASVFCACVGKQRHPFCNSDVKTPTESAHIKKAFPMKFN